MPKKIKKIIEYFSPSTQNVMNSNRSKVTLQRKKYEQKKVINNLAGKQREPDREGNAERHPSIPHSHTTKPTMEEKKMKRLKNILEVCSSVCKNKIKVGTSIIHKKSQIWGDVHKVKGDEIYYTTVSGDKMKSHIKDVKPMDLDESRDSEFRAHSQLSAIKGRKPGHYLMRSGSVLHSVPHPTAQAALKAYHGLANQTGVKIHHVKEELALTPDELKKYVGDGKWEMHKTTSPGGHAEIRHKSTGERKSVYVKKDKMDEAAPVSNANIDYDEAHKHIISAIIKKYRTGVLTRDAADKQLRDHGHKGLKENFDGSKVVIHSPGHRYHGREAHVFHRFDDGRVNAQIRKNPRGIEANLTLKPGEFKLKEEIAMAAGAAGDPGHVQNANDNYAAQKKRCCGVKNNLMRRKAPK